MASKGPPKIRKGNLALLKGGGIRAEDSKIHPPPFGSGVWKKTPNRKRLVPFPGRDIEGHRDIVPGKRGRCHRGKKKKNRCRVTVLGTILENEGPPLRLEEEKSFHGLQGGFGQREKKQRRTGWFKGNRSKVARRKKIVSCLNAGSTPPRPKRKAGRSRSVQTGGGKEGATRTNPKKLSDTQGEDAGHLKRSSGGKGVRDTAVRGPLRERRGWAAMGAFLRRRSCRRVTNTI